MQPGLEVTLHLSRLSANVGARPGSRFRVDRPAGLTMIGTKVRNEY